MWENPDKAQKPYPTLIYKSHDPLIFLFKVENGHKNVRCLINLKPVGNRLVQVAI